MRPFDHVCGGGSETCALRMRCLAGIVVSLQAWVPRLTPGPYPITTVLKPLTQRERGKSCGILCTRVGHESNNTVQLGMAVDRRPPYSVLRGPWDLSHRKWIVAPFLRRTRYPSPRPSLTTSATPNDSPTVCQHA